MYSIGGKSSGREGEKLNARQTDCIGLLFTCEDLRTTNTLSQNTLLEEVNTKGTMGAQELT